MESTEGRREVSAMGFEAWYEKNCIQPGQSGAGMFCTYYAEWIYKEDAKEIWDSIMKHIGLYP